MTRSSVRDHVTVAVVWLALCGAGFVILFGYDSTDDYAGWLIALPLAQIAPYIALATARHGEPLSVGRRVALVLPTALWVGMCWFLLVGAIGSRIWRDAFDFTGPILGLLAGLASAIAFGIVFGRDRRPHPRGARAVLLVHLITACVVGVPAALVGRNVDPGLYVVIAVPIAWPLPLLLACRKRPSEPPVPVARVVS